MTPATASATSAPAKRAATVKKVAAAPKKATSSKPAAKKAAPAKPSAHPSWKDIVKVCTVRFLQLVTTHLISGCVNRKLLLRTPKMLVQACRVLLSRRLVIHLIHKAQHTHCGLIVRRDQV